MPFPNDPTFYICKLRGRKAKAVVSDFVVVLDVKVLLLEMRS